MTASAGPAGVAHDPDRGSRRAVAAEDGAGFADLGRDGPCSRVVEGDDEIGGGGRFQAATDRLPGGEQIGEGDDAKSCISGAPRRAAAACRAETPGTISMATSCRGPACCAPAFSPANSSTSPAMP